MSNPTYSVETFGNESEPVVVIDGFSDELDRLIRMGRSARYTRVEGYPGLRSPLDPNYLGVRGGLLAPILAREFGLTEKIRIESCNFSIVAVPPEHLQPAQRIPHYDGAETDLIAVVQYTQGAQTGGTSFYRHRRTGFETITQERVDLYRAAIADDNDIYGSPRAAYHHGDSDRYEMIGEVAARPDRLILYRGCRLHSGYIPQKPVPAEAIASGRLTVTAFLTSNP